MLREELFSPQAIHTSLDGKDMQLLLHLPTLVISKTCVWHVAYFAHDSFIFYTTDNDDDNEAISYS